MNIRKYMTVLMFVTILHAGDSTNTALRWAIAGQAADLITTEIGLANGGTELNPLMTDRTVRIIAKMALSAMVYVYTTRYPEDKRGAIILAIVSWIPVGNNLIQLGKL